MLAAFGQCADIPQFDFNICEHRLQDWLRLYASAIRCSLQKCGRGFVFLVLSENLQNIHATLMYFDIKEKTRLLIQKRGVSYLCISEDMPDKNSNFF